MNSPVSPSETVVDLPHVVANIANKEEPSSTIKIDQLVGSPEKDEDMAKDIEAIPESLAMPPVQDGPDSEYPEGGRGWFVVMGCSIIAAVTLGWPLAWGVFQAYYSEVVFRGTPNSTLSFLGSMPGAVMTPVAFLSGKLADRYGYRPFIIAGCICNFLGLLFAAFSTQLWQYFLTQGVLQGVAVGLVLPVAMSYPSMWFKKRRGLATGMVIAGSSFGGGAASLIVQELLTTIGLKWTLLTYSCIHLVVMTASVFMLKSRAHPGAPDKGSPIIWWDARLFSDPVFWSISMAVFLTVFGYLTPYFYIQEYTMAMVPGITPRLASVPAAVMNFSASIGRTTIGHFADRIGVCNAFIMAVTIAGLVQLVLWNFAFNYGVIIVFSMIFGFFGGAFVSLMSVLGAKCFGVHNLATLSGILLLFNTPGNIAGAPVAGAIFTASGNNWHAPITYSGLAQIAGGIVILYTRFKKEPRLFAIW